MFSSLKIKNFRLYWLGMFVSLTGSWIQTVAQSWLVFQLTKSAFLLGLVGFLGLLPVFVLSLFAGVAADRFNKRKILICTQAVFMILAFALAVLTQFKIITPAQIMLISLFNGAVMAFDGPARQAWVAELVGQEHLLNAVALNSAAFNSSRIIGPALAGILVASFGMSSCFYVNALSFLVTIGALLWIRPEVIPMTKKRGGLFSELAEGLNFIKGNHLVIMLISMVGIVSLFGLSYIILMPIIANDVLGVGLKGLGMLMSASGAGALIAALTLARLGNFKNKGRLLVFSSFLFSLSLVTFSFSKVYLFSLALLVLLGWSSVFSVSLMNALLQQASPNEVRGRVMSAFMWTFAGIMPFGSLLSGILAHHWGVHSAILLGGLACSAFFCAINIFYPKIRSLS